MIPVARVSSSSHAFGDPRLLHAIWIFFCEFLECFNAIRDSAHVKLRASVLGAQVSVVVEHPSCVAVASAKQYHRLVVWYRLAGRSLHDCGFVVAGLNGILWVNRNHFPVSL